MLRAEVAVNRRFRHLVGVRPRGFHRAVGVVLRINRLRFVPVCPKRRIRCCGVQLDCLCGGRFRCPARIRGIDMAGARHGNLRLRAFRRGLVRRIAGSIQPLLRHVEAVQTFLLARQLVVRHGDGGAGVRIALRRHETVRRAIADAEREGGFVLVLDLLHLVAVALPDGLILLVEARHSVLRESAEHDLACVQAADAHDPRDRLEAVVRDPRTVLLLFAGQAEGQRILHVFRLRAFTPALLGFDGQLRDLVVPQRRRAACVLRVRLRIGGIPVREVLARVLRETAVCQLAVEAARHVQFPEAVGVGVGVLDNAVFHGDRVGCQPLELGAPFVRFCQRDRVAAFRAALRPRAVDVIPARLVERDLHAAKFLGNRVLCAIRRVPFLGQVDADFAVLVLRAVDVGQRRRDRAGGFAGVRVDDVGDAGCGVARHFALDDVVNVVELVAVRVRAGGFQLRPLGVPAVRCRQRSLATAVSVVRVLANFCPLRIGELRDLRRHFVNRCAFRGHRDAHVVIVATVLPFSFPVFPLQAENYFFLMRHLSGVNELFSRRILRFQDHFFSVYASHNTRSVVKCAIKQVQR